MSECSFYRADRRYVPLTIPLCELSVLEGFLSERPRHEGRQEHRDCGHYDSME